MEEKKSAPANSDSNLMAALSYVWILCLYVIIAKRSDEFVRFHAKQGLILFIISILAMALAPFVFFLSPIIWAAVVVLEILGFMKALTGERYKIPLIGKLSEKI